MVRIRPCLFALLSWFTDFWSDIEVSFIGCYLLYNNRILKLQLPELTGTQPQYNLTPSAVRIFSVCIVTRTFTEFEAVRYTCKLFRLDFSKLHKMYYIVLFFISCFKIT